MNCKEFHIKLAENSFLNNHEFKKHLENCSECRFLAEFYHEGFEKYLFKEMKTDDSFYSGLNTKMSENTRVISLQFLQKKLLPIAIAASIAFAIFSGYLIGNSNSFLYPEAGKADYDEYMTFMDNQSFTENYFNLMDYE